MIHKFLILLVTGYAAALFIGLLIGGYMLIDDLKKKYFLNNLD